MAVFCSVGQQIVSLGNQIVFRKGKQINPNFVAINISCSFDLETIVIKNTTRNRHYANAAQPTPDRYRYVFRKSFPP